MEGNEGAGEEDGNNNVDLMNVSNMSMTIDYQTNNSIMGISEAIQIAEHNSNILL